ncbi:MAG: OadG family protein [Muribaculaceae bacterium]|nr:OadG family protein [Muribaculaceae bacterium]
MTDGNLSNGLVLLGMGMGFVLVFLTILIFAMFVLKHVVAYLNKLFPEAVEEVKTTAKKVSAGVDEAIAIALAAVAARRGR